jgi:hypothetical protein
MRHDYEAGDEPARGIILALATTIGLWAAATTAIIIVVVFL